MAVVSQSPPPPCCFRPHCPEVPLFELETDTVKTSRTRSEAAVLFKRGIVPYWGGGTPASSTVLSQTRLRASEAPGPPESGSESGARKQPLDRGGAAPVWSKDVAKSLGFTPPRWSVCLNVRTHMCAYQDKITMAHRKRGRKVRKGGLKSNMPWEPGSLTHISIRADKWVLWSKDTLGSYISLTSDTETTQITTAVCGKSMPSLSGV